MLTPNKQLGVFLSKLCNNFPLQNLANSVKWILIGK